MFKLVMLCALATLVASKPSTLISTGTSSITTEEKTEIRHHVPLTEVHLGSPPILKTTEILTPTAEIIQPVSHQIRTELHKPIIKTTEIIAPSAKILQPYPGVHFRSPTIIGGSPLTQQTGILEHAPLLKNSGISHSYIESTKSDFITAPHAVLGYSPLSKAAIAPYASFGADPLIIPSIGATEYLVHQPLRYL